MNLKCAVIALAAVELVRPQDLLFDACHHRSGHSEQPQILSNRKGTARFRGSDTQNGAYCPTSCLFAAWPGIQST